MDYSTLNRAIFDYWESQSEGSDYFLFVYDDDHHHELLSKLDISEKEYFDCIRSFGRYSWRKFLEKSDGLPFIFGIISLQLLAASRMTGQEINGKICEYLDCTESDLQLKYYNPAQEAIWKLAAKFLSRKGFKVNIPPPKTHKGRYIQYPLSQSYLRIADLRKLRPYLSEKTEDIIIDELRFQDFTFITNLDRPYNIPNIYKTSLFKAILKKGPSGKTIMQHQIFTYFRSHPDTKEFMVSKRRQKKLYFDYDEGFFLFYGDAKEPIDVNHLDEFTRNGSKTLFFREDPQMGDFHQVGRLDFEQKYKIVLLINPNRTKYRNLTFKKTHGVYMVDITIDASLKELFSEYLSRQKPQLEINGGIKVNRSTYLHEFGPTLIFSNNCKSVIINRDRKKVSETEMDLSGLPPGEYAIQVNSEVSRKFSIVKSPEKINMIWENLGWNMEDLSIGGDDVIGQWFKTIKTELTPALFMKYHRGYSKSMLNTSSNNLVLQNIKRQIR